MPRKPHVVVIGAGVSGLTAADELIRGGCAVTVLERRGVIGGLARTTAIDGRPVDRYYHFICAGDNNLRQFVHALGLDDTLHWRPGRTAYVVNGMLHPFTTPLDILGFSAISLASRIRFGLHGMRARRFTEWRKIENLTARQWLIESIGEEAYQAIWAPLLKTKFGAYADEVSAPWIWHRIHRVITSRTSMFKPETLGCLERGTDTLLGALRDRIAGPDARLELSTPARMLRTGDGRITGVTTDRGALDADAVISTAPLPQLRELLPESEAEYRNRLADIPFLGIACLLLKTTTPITRNFWVNVNDQRAPFNGFVEYTNLNPRVLPQGHALIYVPLYMSTEDDRFGRDDPQFADDIFSGLEALFDRFDRSQVTDWLVTRDRYAQAVCRPGFAERVPDIASPVKGLFVTDSTQLYPADRNISGMIALARRAAGLCMDAVRR